MIKILIGGSPCTHWSIAQKNNREVTAEGLGWELFNNFLIAKKKFKPDYFLYENNKSAATAIKNQIAEELERPLQYINSALVSAQNRNRFYVHNIEGVQQPEDRGILLKDVIEHGEPFNDKAYTLTTRCGGAIPEDTLKRHRHTMVAEQLEAYGGRIIGRRIGENGKRQDYNEDIEIKQRFELNKNPDKTNCISTVDKDNMIAKPVRIGDIPSKSGKISGSQANRVYSINGKSVNLVANGGGGGAKTGLYAMPVKVGEVAGGGQGNRIYSEDGKSVTITAGSGGIGSNTGLYAISEKGPGAKVKQSDKLHKVEGGQIEFRGVKYPIKLPDGYYIIRKLTIKECCRLQTLPDDYCDCVSKTQAYKGLGNGWTAEVIIHILSHLNIPKDEEIIVLSMYDGIGTGRYCFDKLGYKNIKYFAYEIDKYAKQIAMTNYPDIIQMGDAFQVREDDWDILKN